jgi:hypothetical protein
MHAILTFLVCAILFSAAVYGLLQLYKWRNGGLLPWQDAPASTPTKPGAPGSPAAPK